MPHEVLLHRIKTRSSSRSNLKVTMTDCQTSQLMKVKDQNGAKWPQTDYKLEDLQRGFMGNWIETLFHHELIPFFLQLLNNNLKFLSLKIRYCLSFGRP